MKYKATAPVGQMKVPDRIKRDILKEFQNPKSESQCITKIKEIKKKLGRNHVGL
jgi:hypothetical protein